jgi:hypothetical protein
VTGDPQAVIKTCKALITAFATLGAQVNFGDPTAPIASTSASGGGAYVRAVQVTPGTPVPAGRAALVRGSGTFRLKLVGGGYIDANDPSGGALYGTVIRDVAVVDADMTNGVGTVTVLY